MSVLNSESFHEALPSHLELFSIPANETGAEEPHFN